MGSKNQEPIVQVLQAVGNPIRKAAIGALRKGGMRFSQLLSSCDLDYDHDTGHFYYHLSELIDKRIVERIGDSYSLTEFGQKVAEMLSTLERECSFLFVEKNKGGEGKMGEKSMETEWIESEWLESKGIAHSLEIKGIDLVRLYMGNSFLQKAITEELPEGPERAKLIKFLEGFKRWKGPATLLVKDKGKSLGWVKVDHSVSWGRKAGKETDKPEFFAKAFIIVKDMLVVPEELGGEDRKEVVSNLLNGLLEKARQTGADSVELLRVDAEDCGVIEALKELGFERITTSYTMMKKLNDE